MSRRKGDFSRFIAEYQTEAGESETDVVNNKERIEELKVRQSGFLSCFVYLIFHVYDLLQAESTS